LARAVVADSKTLSLPVETLRARAHGMALPHFNSFDHVPSDVVSRHINSPNKQNMKPSHLLHNRRRLKTVRDFDEKNENR
jgi:hypothetical protein